MKSIVALLAAGMAAYTPFAPLATAAGKPVLGPFYPQAARPMAAGSNLDRAQTAMFRDGDYVKARNLLTAARKTNANDPLVYALSAVYPFMVGDLAQVKKYGDRTVKTAKTLQGRNAVRGNLYQGVGLAIGAAYEFKQNGALNALNKLQQVFKYIDAAKAIDPNDPELNLIVGYMNLLLSVNLPFADLNDAISQLEKAQPKYLAYRGMYLGYRDLKQFDRAIASIDRAIAIAPQNPELKYYKAQIYSMRGIDRRSQQDLKIAIDLFAKAYQKRSQLLTSTVAQILSENCQANIALKGGKNFDRCWELEAKVKRDNSQAAAGPTRLPN
jgi:tetratricopeptide (TPR) repeat protein